ncbi:uncharacterized protein LOC105844855 isoform X3 [Hydra vulgaris]|uniref:Uncharacterized protein LOC105844855 isoform X3 n=2 Tax=Hydra vulgaris TaxID=6087 RepID=A0ABM4CPG1_HYDVU
MFMQTSKKMRTIDTLLTILFYEKVFAIYESFVMKEERVIKANSLAATLKTLPKEYSISFEVNVSSFITNNWTNIIHFTIKENNNMYGDRTPAVFFYPSKIGIMQICAPVNGSKNYAILSNEIKLLEWTKVTITQLLVDGHYKYSIQVAGMTLYTITNYDAREFSNVKIYASNPWHIAQPGFLRNIIVKNACATNNLYCKPLLKVKFDGILSKLLLNLTFQIDYAYEPGEQAVNLDWEYFLPSYVKVLSESETVGFVKINSTRFKYKIPLTLPNVGISQWIITSIDNTAGRCLYPDVYKIEIPMRLYFQNSARKVWNKYKTVKKYIRQNCVSVVQSNRNHVLEFYNRGIHWDAVNSQIYVCMNQHVRSTKPACYYSKDNGVSWTGMDIRIGSVLGHHNLSGELYAIHRNRKLYLVFHSTHKSWLAVTNDEFKVNIMNKIDWKRIKIFEKDVDQVVTFGPNQWMGNAEGLFFRNSSDIKWIKRAKWK